MKEKIKEILVKYGETYRIGGLDESLTLKENGFDSIDALAAIYEVELALRIIVPDNIIGQVQAESLTLEELVELINNNHKK